MQLPGKLFEYVATDLSDCTQRERTNDTKNPHILISSTACLEICEDHESVMLGQSHI